MPVVLTRIAHESIKVPGDWLDRGPLAQIDNLACREKVSASTHRCLRVSSAFYDFYCDDVIAMTRGLSRMDDFCQVYRGLPIVVDDSVSIPVFERIF